MEDTFQFIIESPQHNTGHKKRPRLVTSCDNCRLKKIKCLQPSPETKCEACKAAKISCRFKDRERYFAERSRAIAGPSANTPAYHSDSRHDSNPALDAFSVASSSSSPALSNAALRSNSHSPKANGLVSAEGEPNGRYPYTSDPRRGEPNQRHSANSSVSSYHSRNNSYSFQGYVNGPGSVPLPNSRMLDHIQLFEPDFPKFPHRSKIHHLIQCFAENDGQHLPFLTYKKLCEDWKGGLLSPALATAVAAVASRDSNDPELVMKGLHNVAEEYTAAARVLVAQALETSLSLDTLHAVMLLAWLDNRNNRLQEARQSTAIAVQLAQQLRLPEKSQAARSDHDIDRLTWASILQLHNTASNNRA